MDYKDVEMGIRGQVREEEAPLANMANFLALIFELDDISWAGFYLDLGKDLVLGPFQGKAACNRIEYGAGVCGAAFKRKEPVLVPDVHDFPGHIACDAGSNSELVIPLIKEGRAYGVLDLDSYKYNRFSKEDEAYFQGLVDILSRVVDWKNLTGALREI